MRFSTLFFLFFLAACSVQPPRTESLSKDQLLANWGPPTARHGEPDGSERWIYSSGPWGFVVRVAVVGARGQVLSVHNALTEEEFARVRPGQDGQAEILRRFGPPTWTQQFDRRKELVWEWRYCDVWSYPARFNVLFDAESGVVRSTLAVREDTGRWRTYCSR